MQRLMWCLSVLLLLACSGFAQSVATAQLSGTVTDPKGAVIPNATVTVRDEGRAFERTTTSGAEGQYQVLQLPPGVYTVTVQSKGFANYTAKNVALTVGQTAELPVTLSISSTETVEVNAQAEIVETQRTSSTNTIEQQRIDNLPTNGRNYINFTLTDSQAKRDVAPSIGAAPTSGINFGGQRARSNLVNLDGMDQVDNSVNGIRSTVSQEAVQEFQIIDNSYAAEYGRASGGVVNIVSRSGNNDFHGTTFGYLRNRNLQATNPFSNVSQPAYTRVQPGFTLGGPIKKDRSFFFLSWEGTYRQETGFSTIGANNFGFVPFPFGGATFMLTPDQAAFIGQHAATTDPTVLQTYLFLASASAAQAVNGVQPSAFGGRPGFASTCTPTTPVCAPLPASFTPLSSLTGNYPVKEHTNVYSLRLDNRLTNTQQLMFRFNLSPSDVTGIQVNAQNQNFGQNAFSRTSVQNYHDFAGTMQHTWTIGNNKVNEFRFQYARRGLRYDFSRGPGGGNVAVNIPGFAFFGREPFSFVNRVERRFQFSDNFSWNLGNHNVKFGADVNYLPLTADFAVNFGGLYNFGELPSSALAPSGFTPAQAAAFSAFPGFSPVQAYGLGLPQVFVQGIGNPHDAFANTPLGFFAQDSWRILHNLTVNYGVRYDVELTPTFAALNPIAAAAQNALGITQGIPRDTNNIAPRLGIAWDPWSDGKTVIRASYGIFYDHPLLALAFDSDVADGTQAPQVLAVAGAPSPACSPQSFNAPTLFQGLFNTSCYPGGNAGFGYLPQEQRFNAAQPNSIFINQNYLTAGFPLLLQPFGFPVAKNFQYAYSEQANFGLEHQFGNDLSLSMAYNFNGGHHLNRPINVNTVHGDLLVGNWENAVAAGDPSAANGPQAVAGCGINPLGKPYIPAAVVSFFRTSGINPSLFPSLALLGPQGIACQGLIQAVMAQDHLGLGVPIPFGDDIANFSNGSSVYHGLTTNLKKRFNKHYEFLASYTWSHAIDDSTDLQSLLEPQNNFRPDLERGNSTFDQRHRLVLSGVYQSGKVGGGGAWTHLASNWTVAPIIELSSGRPFSILVGSDANFDASSNTDRPNIVTAAQASAPVPPGCLPAVASKYSPTGFLQPACFFDGTFDGISSNSLNGSLGRNSATRPFNAFTDFRVARTFHMTERFNLEGMVDMFNLINKFNVADVNPLYTQAGTPTAAFDPRQFQFGLKLSW